MSTLEEVEGVPQKWIDLHVDKLIKAGWRPRIKRKGDKQYLTVRLGNQERGLGLATDETIALFGNLFPSVKGMLSNPRNYPAKRTEKILTIPLKKPEEIGTSYRPSLEVLHWYSWTKKDLGYPGGFGDFLNSIVKEYFEKYQNIEFGVIFAKD